VLATAIGATVLFYETLIGHRVAQSDAPEAGLITGECDGSIVTVAVTNGHRLSSFQNGLLIV
jgi:hypothetical protein